MSKSKKKNNFVTNNDYSTLITDISGVLENARKFSARAINTILTSTYWLIGRRIVEYEFQGMDRSEYYGDKLLENLSIDLQKKFGRGFSRQNIQLMKQFYETYLFEKISQTPSGKSSGNANIFQTLSNKSLAADNIPQTPSAQSLLIELSNNFPLPWSHYVRLLSVKNKEAKKFYESESLRNGWSVRQLDRQISSQFYERTLLSKNKAAMLKKGEKPLPQEIFSAEEEIKDPYILEFLNLKDEYSENDLEEALINHLEKFLLELGSDFAFIGRQKRLRIGSVWYRVDLIFFHRKLRCLVVIDLKVGKFTHADAGQMHLYLNFAKEHWTNKDENPPVGLILCAEKDSAVAKYALDGLPNKILASEYKLVLPDEKLLQKEIKKTQKWLYEKKKLKG
ncbi:MAG: PDDEXK nuclease domain-containing protein [Melioribacteraceae bacterium]